MSADATAHYLAEQLSARGVAVRYPGLASHPQHALAQVRLRLGQAPLELVVGDAVGLGAGAAEPGAILLDAIDGRLHGLSVELAVSLGARASHGGTPAAVQQPELDAARVGHPTHHPAESVDLADQVTLGQAAGNAAADLNSRSRQP